MATMVGSLYTTLTLDSASFQSNMKRAATAAEQGSAQISKALTAAKTAAIGFASAFAVDQFLGLARNATDFASSLGETAQQLGFTTRSLQELRFAATQSGASLEQADSALGKFSVNVGKARDGNAKLRDAFAAVGVSVTDLANLDTPGLFAKVADGVAAIPDPARRAAAEVALLGKGGQSLGALLGGGSAGLREFADQADRTGAIISDKAITALDNLKDSGDRLKLVFDAQLANLIGENAGSILGLGNAAADAVGKLAGFLNQMRGVAALLKRGDFLGTITNSEQELERLGRPGGFVQRDTAEVSKLRGELANLKRSGGTGALQRETQAELTKALALQQQGVSEALNTRFPLSISPKPFGGSGNFSVAGIKGPKARASAAPKVKPTKDADFDPFEAQFGSATNREAAIESLTQLTTEGERLRDAITDTSLAPLALELPQVTEKFSGLATIGENFTADIQNGLIDAIASGGNLGDVLVDAFKRAAAAAAVSGIFNLLGGALGGGGGFLGGLFGGGQADAFGSTFASGDFTVPGYADGGSPAVGRLSMVGERGPELFVPRVPGTIIPNSALKGLGGGGQQGVAISIEPSPLFITSARTVAVQGGRQAAQEALSRDRRANIPRGRGI